MFDYLKHNIKGYASLHAYSSVLKIIFYLLFTQELWAVVVYRFGSWTGGARIPLIGKALRIAYFFLNKFIELTTGIFISSKAHIGKRIPHSSFRNDIYKRRRCYRRVVPLPRV